MYMMSVELEEEEEDDEEEEEEERERPELRSYTSVFIFFHFCVHGLYLQHSVASHPAKNSNLCTDSTGPATAKSLN
jgi:hypothetical protein